MWCCRGPGRTCAGFDTLQSAAPVGVETEAVEAAGESGDEEELTEQAGNEWDEVDG